METKKQQRPAAATTGTAGESRKQLLPDLARRNRLRRIRAIKDRFSKDMVSVGGISVIVALALIFVFLFIEVIPMLRGAAVQPQHEYPVPGLENGGQVLLLDMDRYHEVGVAYLLDAEKRPKVVFYDLSSGKILQNKHPEVPDGVQVTAHAAGEPRTNILALGLSDGQAMVLAHEFEVVHAQGSRTINPRLGFPYGDSTFELSEGGEAIKAIGVQRGPRGTVVAAASADQRLFLGRFDTRTDFMTGGEITVLRNHDLGRVPGVVKRLMLSANLYNLFVVTGDGYLHYYDISRPEAHNLVDSRPAFPEPGVELTAAELLLGTTSLIVGSSTGVVRQYFPVREQDNVSRLRHIRDFQPHRAPVTSLAPEIYRKGFYSADRDGVLQAHYPASARTVLTESVSSAPLLSMALSPVQRLLMVHDADGKLHLLGIRNDHPDVSLSALWRPVHYEGRSSKDYIWQSSSATDDFEPKFSLVPLTLGTIKAAFYAMLIAMPLAIMGAVYTAYFMSPRLRRVVKPSIEIMEALPTVILGFLAGLWLAPFVENNLPAIFSILIFTPMAMLIFAFCWGIVPWSLKNRISDGWEAAILVPVVLLVGWASIQISPLIEIWLFDGSARQWLTDVGITYDQRNALVVGLAMGFAVIPTIFSIAEDAVFSVPRHLTEGSLAMGATRWQTVTRIVLLTASPGIFSAIMIGFGRAVGETMIVLMATGNSPVLNFNIFEGMRTLSANIAVELTETAVGGTHYRILFLSALVLFLLTFLLNTAAEVVRQRLRKRYSSL